MGFNYANRYRHTYYFAPPIETILQPQERWCKTSLQRYFRSSANQPFFHPVCGKSLTLTLLTLPRLSEADSFAHNPGLLATRYAAIFSRFSSVKFARKIWQPEGSGSMSLTGLRSQQKFLMKQDQIWILWGCSMSLLRQGSLRLDKLKILFVWITILQVLFAVDVLPKNRKYLDCLEVDKMT